MLITKNTAFIQGITRNNSTPKRFYGPDSGISVEIIYFNNSDEGQSLLQNVNNLI